MQLNDMYAQMPGISTATETYEQSFRWGQYGVGIITGAQISSAAADSGNTPTWELRPGLVLGQITSSGLWTNYSPTNTDGSEVAAGILMEGLRMQDLLGNAVARFFGILVGGPVQGVKLLGLDQQARQQMKNHFQFDDDFVGNGWYPYKRQISKGGNYTVLASDNGTQFYMITGAVTFTLPTIANGLSFGFYNSVAATMTISSTTNNIVTFNNATGTNIAFSTGGQQIGSSVRVYSNPGATAWLTDFYTANTPTIS